MKKQDKNFKQRTHWSAVMLAAATAFASLMPSVALAWGPERQTYTMQNPADKVTFNSITDNPALGDERNFVRVREAGVGQFVNEIEIQPGKEYEVYIYYHNNAKSSLNASGAGIANGTKVSTQFPASVKPSQKGQVSGTITATDADPTAVWDEAWFTTQYDEVLLRYKLGSATIHNSFAANGMGLSTDMFKEVGTYIGMNELDGRVPGCAEFTGYITYTLIAENVGAKIDKTVSVDGTNFAENVTVKAGDTVTYQVVFKNTGSRTLTNVTFHDVLPEGVSLVDGTTYLYNANYPNGEKLSNLIDKNGYNLGLYDPGTESRIVYKAKVSKDAGCGNLVNRMYVDHDDGQLSDGATINIEGCEIPTELPETGPAEIVLALVVVAGIGVGVTYWVRSRMALKKLSDEAEGK